MKKFLRICSVFAAVAVLGLGTASCKHGHGGGGGGGGPVYTPGNGGGGGSSTAPGGTAVGIASSDATTNYTTPTAGTLLELQVLSEMNFARTDPQGYVRDRLIPQRTNWTVDTYSSTFQATLEECIAEMSAMSPISELQWGGRLKMSAMEWVNVQGALTTRTHGHAPNLYPRIRKYCSWSGAGENLSYGYLTAHDIVLGLIVDDGIADRGHRYNILDYTPKGENHASRYTHAGVAIGDHGFYGTMSMCAINYAYGYSEPPLPTP